MIKFEISNKPWFGPRKRAREFLYNRNTILGENQTLRWMINYLGGDHTKIQFIRFIRFFHKKEKYDYSIMLVWCDSDDLFRQLLYDNALSIVKATGWYPLPQGERMFSNKVEKLKYSVPNIFLSENIESIESAVQADGGCSIRLFIGNKSVLLDSGLPDFLHPMESDVLCFISHIHTDHTGGIKNLLKKNIPIIMSDVTARLLIMRDLIDQSMINQLIHIFSTKKHQWISLGGEIKVKPISVPHAPGATGYLIVDQTKCIFFPGDISFRTYRHNFINNLVSEINSLSSNLDKYVLIDSTMIGRQYGADKQNIAKSFFSKINRYDNVLLCSADIEQLLYAYLDIFYFIKENHRGQCNYILSENLKPLFRYLHRAFIFREFDDIDPFILSQYGKNMSSWAESRWLFWSKDEIVNNNNQNIFFLDQSEMYLVKNQSSLVAKSIGRLSDEIIRDELNCEILDIDTQSWSLHSNEEVILESIQTMGDNINYIFFHNYKKRINRFIKKYNFPSERHKALYNNLLLN